MRGAPLARNTKRPPLDPAKFAHTAAKVIEP